MSLSTHVLDTARGLPAAQLQVVLYRIEPEQRTEIARERTNDDGRIATPFGGDLPSGTYELVFDAGGYHARTGAPSFYNGIPVRFIIEDASRHYHVPLLLSPWGYSTYRGT